MGGAHTSVQVIEVVDAEEEDDGAGTVVRLEEHHAVALHLVPLVHSAQSADGGGGAARTSEAHESLLANPELRVDQVPGHG